MLGGLEFGPACAHNPFVRTGARWTLWVLVAASLAGAGSRASADDRVGSLIVVVEADRARIDAGALRRALASALTAEVVALTDPRARRARGILTVFLSGSRALLHYRSDGGLQGWADGFAPATPSGAMAWLVEQAVGVIQAAHRAGWGTMLASEVIDPFAPAPPVSMGRSTPVEVIDPWEDAVPGREARRPPERATELDRPRPAPPRRR